MFVSCCWYWPRNRSLILDAGHMYICIYAQTYIGTYIYTHISYSIKGLVFPCMEKIRSASVANVKVLDKRFSSPKFRES